MPDSALIKAVQSGNREDFSKIIESKRADVNQKDSNGFSAILWGSWKGYLDIVETLLSNGARINDKNNNGYSPILYACMSGHINVVSLLLSKGANILDIASNGRTCFSLARDQKNYNKYRGLLYRLRKWPTTMGIIVIEELGLYNLLETDSLEDLHQFIGKEDFSEDNEEDYYDDVVDLITSDDE